MIKKWGISAAALLLTAAVILPGCANKQEPPKEALQTAAAKVTELTSYEMKSKLTINQLSIEAPSGGETDATTTMVLNMLQNAELSVEGVYQADPMQTEMTMVLNLKGDLAMSFNVPMVMTAEKMYVKVPSIPLLPLPENIVGKFIEFDLKELAEQEGAEFNPAALDRQKTQKLSNEVMSTLLAEYDESEYFAEVEPKDAALPEDVEAQQVVQFAVTNDNVKEAITIFLNNALPKIMDILSKDEYKDILQLDPADLEEAKQELQSGEARTEIDQELANLDSYLTINQFQLNTAIDKNDFPVYQDLLMDFVVNVPEEDQKISLSLTGSNQYSKVNEEQTFTIGIPQGDEVITMDELQNEFGAVGTY